MDSSKKRIIINSLAFVAPVISLMVIWYAHDISYGKGQTLFTYDMREQYAPFLAGLRYLIQDPRKLLFNWNYCMGGNYLGVYAYYLSSPLNLITLFWSIEDFPDAIYVLTLLKIGLCGLTFNLFLQGKYKEKGVRYSNIVFVLCYVLMSYHIVYMFCIMWMDAWILLPLIMLGIEQILEDRKSFLYFISVTFLFISNYYMAYIMGVYIAIYFFIRVCEKEKVRQLGKYLIRVIIMTVLGLFISMPIVLPAVLNQLYKYGNKLDSAQLKNYDINPVHILKKLLPFQYDTIQSEGGLPYVFCGTLTYIMVIVFFSQKRKLNEKICNLALLLLTCIGFFVSEVDLFWHGFQMPHGLPYRYAFLFSTTLIMIAYNAWIDLKNGGLAIEILTILLLIYTAIEICSNGIYILGKMKEINKYEKRFDYDISTEFYAPLANKIMENQNFYRMSNSEHYLGYNVETMYDLKGMNFSASSNNYLVCSFLKNMGSCDFDLTANGFSLLPLVDSLLGIKYRIATYEPMNMYKEIANTSRGETVLRLYENPDALELGYMIDQGVLKRELFWSDNPFENQINSLKYLGIEESQVFEPLAYSLHVEDNNNNIDLTVDFNVNKNSNVCFYLICAVNSSDTINYFIDGKWFNITGSLDSKKIIVIPAELSSGRHTLKITGRYSELSGFYMYAFDKDIYQAAIEKLKNSQMSTIEIDGNVIIGHVDAKEKGILFTTLPYDEGYTVYVDGAKTDYCKIMNTFIGLELNEGEHTVKFVYIPQGLRCGILLMLLGVLGASGFFCNIHDKRVR